MWPNSRAFLQSHLSKDLLWEVVGCWSARFLQIHDLWDYGPWANLPYCQPISPIYWRECSQGHRGIVWNTQFPPEPILNTINKTTRIVEKGVVSESSARSRHCWGFHNFIKSWIIAELCDNAIIVWPTIVSIHDWSWFMAHNGKLTFMLQTPWPTMRGGMSTLSVWELFDN